MGSAAVDVDLDSDILDQLNSPETRALLDTIDSLRALQQIAITDISLKLPQIIVVGDQSSGKSSVLEAISRVRFPVSDDVCTRFATELALRRDSEVRVDVNIQWADKSPAGSSTREPFHRTGFSKESLPDIINEAKERMGIRNDFSKDILRVQISGPDVYPLTLVDLPGYFKGSSAEQTPQGKATVDALIESYMKQEKSIILAVVAANYNLVHQVVLDEAKRHDPNYERTIGVITKPDLAGARNNVQKYLELARGKEAAHKLTLGCFVLRNRSEEEAAVDFDVRDANELSFFRTGPWAGAPKEGQGVEKLRRRLSKILLTHVRANLPELLRDIDANLSSRKEALKRLGRPRSTAEDKKAYLLDIAETYQRLARDAVDGRYSDAFFGDVYQVERKLRAVLRKLNRAFDATLVAKGSTYDIESDRDWKSEISGESERDSLAYLDEEEEGDENVPGYLQPFMASFKHFKSPEPISTAELGVEIERLAAHNLGKQFPGSANSELALQFFRTQSKPWRDIAKHYLALTLDYSKAFVEVLLTHIMGADSATASSIISGCMDPFFDKKRDELEAKLDELIRPYKEGYGVALDSVFHTSMSKVVGSRLASRVADLLQNEYPDIFKPEHGGKGEKSLQVKLPLLSRDKIMKAVLADEALGSSEMGTEKVIDMVVTYYDMSLHTFTENVVNLAAESCLVAHIADILSPSMVYRMSDEKLDELAAESDEVETERAALKRDIEILEECRRMCRKNMPRESNLLPDLFGRSHARPDSRSVSPVPASSAKPAPASTAAHPSAIPSARGKPPSVLGSSPVASSGSGNAASSGTTITPSADSAAGAQPAEPFPHLARLFAAVAPAPGGKPPPTGPLFGTPSGDSPGGAAAQASPAPPKSGLFGGLSASPASTARPSPFGGGSAPSPFGTGASTSGAKSIFDKQPTGSGGASAPSAFGTGTSASGAKSIFDKQPTGSGGSAPSAFGASSGSGAPSLFAAASSSPFGQARNGSPSAFGTSAGSSATAFSAAGNGSTVAGTSPFGANA